VILLLALVCLGGALFFLGEVVTLPARQRTGLLRRASSWGRRDADEQAEQAAERRLQPLRERLARMVLRLNPRLSVEQVSLRLLSAGLGRRITPTTYLAGKSLLTIVGLVLGVLIGSGSSPVAAVALGLMCSAGGFVALDLLVGSRAKTRREQIQATLPDTLDLLAVSVEAGLGFDGAVIKVTEKMTGPLAEEFTMMLGELRIGESRTEALKKLAERTASPEVAAFTRAIIQADQFGISLGRILKVQATEARLKRQAAAEERAMKAPIKMLIPTVIFIFPALFLISLGPAALSIKKVL
jgi:tight adherence protein C